MKLFFRVRESTRVRAVFFVKSTGITTMRYSLPGFTLIELLVVISIIAVLAAMLLPMVSMVKASAQTTNCGSNQRQFALAVELFMQDNEHQPMPYAVSSTGMWMARLKPYHDDVDKIRLCPTAARPSLLASYCGSAVTSWGSNTPVNSWLSNWTGSYGFNAWYYGNGYGLPLNDPGMWLRWPPEKSSLVPIISDSIWVDQIPSRGDGAPTDLQLGTTMPGAGGMPRVCIDRHRHAVNVAFCDGHVALVRLAGLWDLTWKNNDTGTKPAILP